VLHLHPVEKARSGAIARPRLHRRGADMTHTYVRWSGLRQLLAELWCSVSSRRGRACSAALLALILATSGVSVRRAGALRFSVSRALVLQALLLARAGNDRRARLIFAFHAIATAMEVFKTRRDPLVDLSRRGALPIGNVRCSRGSCTARSGATSRAWKCSSCASNTTRLRSRPMCSPVRSTPISTPTTSSWTCEQAVHRRR